MSNKTKTLKMVSTSDFTLENGLKVIYAPRHYLPIVTIMIAYPVGGYTVWKGKTGIAHFLEHMMFKGTKKFPKGEIDSITQKLGGHNNAYTTSDYTCYYFMFAKEYWEKALEIESDRMKNCLWSQEDFASEKKVILEELSTSLDNPVELLDQEVESIVFEKHPYKNPIIGWRKDIESLTFDELKSFYENYYTPDNATVVVVGDITKKEVTNKVKKYFGKVTPSGIRPSKFAAEPEPTKQKRISLVNQVELSRFELLFPTCKVGCNDDYTLDIIDTLLTTGKTSRLYRRLVIEEQILQVVVSMNDTRKFPGLFRIIGEAHPGICEKKVEDIIFEEITKLKKTQIGVYELTKAKNILISEFISQQETNFDLAEKIVQFEMLSSYEEIHSIIKKVEKITPRDVQLVCEKYFKSERVSIGWSIPKEKKSLTHKRIKRNGKVTLRGMRVPQDNKPIEIHSQNDDANIFTRTIHEKTLDNGLTILFMENKNLPNFSMNIHIKGGYIYENREKAGCAHLMGRLLSEGSQKYSTYKTSCTCEFLGAGIRTSSTIIETKGFVRNFSQLCDIVTDMILAPTFHKDLLENQKMKVITGLISSQDNCSYQARQEFMRLIYNDHPYGRAASGTIESVSKISRRDILQLHKKYYCPNNTVIAVVGDMEKEDVFSTIDKYLGKWPHKKVGFHNLPELYLQEKKQELFIPMEKQQINVYWGHLGIKRANPDYYYLLVLDHILGMGAGFTDRLSKKVRDEMGLVYNIWASITASASIEPGNFCTFFATDPKNYSQAIKVIQEEITSIQKGDVSEEEIENAKAYLIGSFIFSFETNSSLADYLVSAYRLKLGYDYVHKFKDIIDKVTKKDIIRVAQKYLHPQKATTVAAGAVHLIK